MLKLLLNVATMSVALMPEGKPHKSAVKTNELRGTIMTLPYTGAVHMICGISYTSYGMKLHMGCSDL